MFAEPRPNHTVNGGLVTFCVLDVPPLGSGEDVKHFRRPNKPHSQGSVEIAVENSAFIETNLQNLSMAFLYRENSELLEQRE